MNWIQLFKKSFPYLIVVIISFLTMAAVSYISARSVMERHLAENAENALVTAEANVAEGLARLELMLLNAFHAVRDMLEQGTDNASVHAYLENTAAWMRRPVNGLPGFYGIYAYIDREFINGIGFEPDADYLPESRPWYHAAQGLADGQVGYTVPYQDVSSGNLIISAVQNLYDPEGGYYGILIIDVELSWFDQYVQSLYRSPGAYGMILNQDMIVINHPDTDLVGRFLGDLMGDHAKIAAELPQNANIRARRITDTDGKTVIVFFRRLHPSAQMTEGWYGALITPVKSYYHDINSIVMNPVFLELVLILLFSMIMLRIIAARIRTEEINFDTSMIKARLEITVKERTAELEQRTEELEVQSRLAKEASEAKGSFLARMSHEIRTPLNAVIGMTEIARHSTSVEKKDESLGKIAAASDHLLGILNDVLDMSKIESGKFTLVHEPLVLDTAMEEVAAIIRQRCEEKRIIFEPDFSLLPNIAVMGDKLRLKQVLINLLGNAVKFTPAAGVIRFRVEISGRDEKQLEVHFLVSDNGIGMREEQMEKLFHPFEQTDASIANRFGGTGLGLSISQNMVQLMGGLITAAGEFGKGSTFEFTLKMEISEQQENTASAGDALPRQDFTGKRILITEDIEINRIILRELLADTNIEFEEAVDGVQALEKFTASPEHYYDLIFMDVQMPNMDGHEAARRIRALDRVDAKTVPIIAMTANAYREDVDKALDAGMNAHLSKPINMKEVRNTLSRWLK
ncbi:hypothetical protein AGMMS49587_18820 [Spirochaetia bacterium]|nr:hypothetical protein AGMMS49587_18820 [Spirochaetia bacterium]